MAEPYSRVGIDALPLSTAFTTVQKGNIGSTAVQLTATPTKVATQPIVKADPSNTAVLYVGAAGVTGSTGFPLAAGDVILVPVDDLSKIWLIAPSGTLKAAAIAGL